MFSLLIFLHEDTSIGNSISPGLLWVPGRRPAPTAISAVLSPCSRGAVPLLPPVLQFASVVCSPMSHLQDKRFVRRMAHRVRRNPSGCRCNKRDLPVLVWDVSNKDTNRLAHALNGNTSVGAHFGCGMCSHNYLVSDPHHLSSFLSQCFPLCGSSS